MKVSPRKVGLITSCSLIFALALTFLAHSGDFRNGTSDIYEAGLSSDPVSLTDSSQERRGDHFVIYHHVVFTLSNSSHFHDHRSEKKTPLSKSKEKKDAVNETLNPFKRKNKIAEYLTELRRNRIKQTPVPGKRRKSDGNSKKNPSTENGVVARLCKKANGKIDHRFLKKWYKVLRIRYPNFKFWLTDILRNCFKDFKKSSALKRSEDKIILKGILNPITVTNKPIQKSLFEKFLKRYLWPNEDFVEDEQKPLHPIPAVFYTQLILPETGKKIWEDSVSNQREFLSKFTSKLYPYPLLITGDIYDSQISKELIPTTQQLKKARYRESTFSIPSKKQVITTQKIIENANLSVQQQGTPAPRLTKQETSATTVKQQEIPAPRLTKQETSATTVKQQETPAPRLTKQETSATTVKQQEIPAPRLTKQETSATTVKQQETPAPRLTKQETSATTVKQQEISTSTLTQQEIKILRVRLESFHSNAAGNAGSEELFPNRKTTNGKGNDEAKPDPIQRKQIFAEATDDSAVNKAVNNYLARELTYLLEITEKSNPFNVEDKHFTEENTDYDKVNVNKFYDKKRRNGRYEKIKSVTKDSSSKNGNSLITETKDNESSKASKVGVTDLDNDYDETKILFEIDGKLSGFEMTEWLKNGRTLCSGNCSKESKDAERLRKSRNDFQRTRRSLKTPINITQLSENMVQRAQNRNKTEEMVSLNDKGNSEIRRAKPTRQGMEAQSERVLFSEGKRDSLNNNETIDDRGGNSFQEMNQTIVATENQQAKEKGRDGIETDKEEVEEGTETHLEEDGKRESDAETTEESNSRENVKYLMYRDDRPSIAGETSAHPTQEMPYEGYDDLSYREKTTEIRDSAPRFSSLHTTPQQKRNLWRLVSATTSSQGITTDAIKYDSHRSDQLVPSNVIHVTTEKMTATKDDVNEDDFQTTHSSVREQLHLHKPIKAHTSPPEVWTEVSQYSSVDDPQRQPKMSGTTSGSNASFKKQSVFSKDDYSYSYEDKPSKVYIAHNDADFAIPEFRPGTLVHAPVLLPRESLHEDDDDSFETVDKVQPGYFLVFRNRGSSDSEAFDPSIKGVRVISSTFFPHRLKEISLHYTDKLENSTTSDSEDTDSSIVSQDDEDEEEDHPWFTMEKLAYLLIGSSCALSILCLLVVIAAIKCRHLLIERRLRQQFRRQLYHPSTWQQNLYGQFMYLHGQPTNSFSSQDSCNCRCVTWSLGARNLDSQPICTTRQSTIFLGGPKKLPFGAASTLRSESMLGRDRRATRPPPPPRPPPKPESSNENDSLEQSSSSESSSKECTCIDPHWTSQTNPPVQQSSAHHTFGKDTRFRNSKECELPLLRHELQSMDNDCPPPVRGSNYLDKAEGVVYWSSNDERLI